MKRIKREQESYSGDDIEFKHPIFGFQGSQGEDEGEGEVKT